MAVKTALLYDNIGSSVAAGAHTLKTKNTKITDHCELYYFVILPSVINHLNYIFFNLFGFLPVYL